jgi:hypothetical protein
MGGASGGSGAAPSGSGGTPSDAGSAAPATGGTAASTVVDGAAPCTFSVAPKAPLPIDPSAPLAEQAAGVQLAVMDATIGRYLRGEIRVYRGTLKAADDGSQVAAASGSRGILDGSIPEGPALAMLDIRAASGTDWTPPRVDPKGKSAFLVVHGIASKNQIVLEQPDSDVTLTEAGMISPLGGASPLMLSCKGCGPRLWERPDTLTFADLTATGTVPVMVSPPGQPDVTARLVASASLSVADACSLRFEDLQLLSSATGPSETDPTLYAFERSGEEMVWHASGAIAAPSVSPCVMTNPYTIDVFVDLGDLAHYGTRNFQPGAPTRFCLP